MGEHELQVTRSEGLADRLTNLTGVQVAAADVVIALAELGLVLHIDPKVERAMRVASSLRGQPGLLTRQVVSDAARRSAVPTAVLLDACALQGLEVLP